MHGHTTMSSDPRQHTLQHPIAERGSESFRLQRLQNHLHGKQNTRGLSVPVCWECDCKAAAHRCQSCPGSGRGTASAGPPPVGRNSSPSLRLMAGNCQVSRVTLIGKKNAEILLEDISSLLLTISIKHLFSLKDGEKDTGLHQGREHSHRQQTSLEQRERAGRRKTN